MDPFLMQLLKFFGQNHVGIDWNDEQADERRNIRWTLLDHGHHNHLWIEVKRRIRPTPPWLFVHVATDSVEFHDHFNILVQHSQELLNGFHRDVPECEFPWMRLGYILPNHAQIPNINQTVADVVMQLHALHAAN